MGEEQHQLSKEEAQYYFDNKDFLVVSFLTRTLRTIKQATTT